MYCMSVSHYVLGTDSPFLPSSGVTAQRCFCQRRAIVSLFVCFYFWYDEIL
jgi:hypothetical protein